MSKKMSVDDLTRLLGAVELPTEIREATTEELFADAGKLDAAFGEVFAIQDALLVKRRDAREQAAASAAVLKDKTDDLLANDEEVKKGRNEAARKAVAAKRSEAEREQAAEDEKLVRVVDSALGRAKEVISRTKRTQELLNAQIELLKLRQAVRS